MDQGTNTSNNGNLATWFEQGFVRDTPTDATYGLPPSGSTFNSQSQPTHHYQMGNYSANNGILIDAGHLVANITPAVLTNVYGAFAFLTAGGNIGSGNVMTNICILQHLDGVNETNLFYGYDWFNGQVAPAFTANGRVNMYSRTVNNLNNNYPRLFESYFPLSDTSSPVTNIEVMYSTAPGGSATTFIMAVSASAGGVPPLITAGALPVEQASYAGQAATFTVSVSGTAPVTNQWLVMKNGSYVPLTDGADANGSTIAGSGTTAMTISGIAVLDATNYEYIAANAFGSATSSPAMLNIRARAGVVPIEGWNNIANEAFTAGGGGSTNVYSSDGAAIATLTLSDEGVTNGWNSGITGDGSVDSLMHGYMDVGSANTADGNVSISGLSDPVYDVYIYCFPDTTRPNVSTNGLPNYTVNGTVYYAPVLGGTGPSTYDLTGTPVGGKGFTGFVQATTYTANDFNQDIPVSAFGNYIKIAQVAAANNTITVDAGADNTSYRSPLNGIELVSTTSGQTFGIHFLGNTTDAINVTPAQPPIIDSQIPAATNAIISVLTNRISAVTVSVTVDSISAPPLYYQWFYGASPISGATNSSYTTIATNGAIYQCIVTNFAGSATSSPVTIAMIPRPQPSLYEAAILALNPVAYWPLSETNGSVAVDYASTNDGTYTGTCTLGQPGLTPTLGVGTNTSVGFDGTTAYVDIPVHNLNITGPITVIAWVQTPSGGEPGFATVVGHSDQSYRVSVVNAASNPRFADAGPDVVSSLSVGDANWHQLVGVYDGVNQYLYVDGQLSAGPTASSPSGSTDDVMIGAAPDYLGSRNFKGNICQVAILAQALSATQVATFYNDIGTPPSVTITPSGASVYTGGQVTFTAQVTGSTPVHLQWYYILNGGTTTNLIPNATNSTYSIPNVPLSDDQNQYGVIASSVYGAAATAVTLSVQNGPAGLSTDISPATGEAYAGAPVTYSVVAYGSAPINYQWLLDGTPVAGATNASYTAAAPCGSHTIQATFANALNGGTAIDSAVVTLQGDASPTNITFNTDGTGWSVNGLATIVDNLLTLTSATDTTGGEHNTAFYTVPQYVGSFAASFVYTGNGSADGATFIVQNFYGAGPSIVGGAGGSLGYSGISNSIAFEINLYSGNGEIPGIAVGTNGSTFATGGAQYTPPTPIDITSADPIEVQLNFAKGVLSVGMKDTVTLATYSTNYALGSLVPILDGSNLGYIGFSGGDGGAVSTQTITNFQFQSIIPALPLSVSKAVSGSITLSWPSADPNYSLQQSPSLTSPSWTDGPTPLVVNGTNQVSVSVSGTTVQFYRLVHSACPVYNPSIR